MNRRNVLRALPVMAGLAATVGNGKAHVYEMKPEKKYLIIVPEYLDAEDRQRIRDVLKGRGINVTVAVEGLIEAIYELE